MATGCTRKWCAAAATTTGRGRSVAQSDLLPVLEWLQPRALPAVSRASGAADATPSPHTHTRGCSTCNNKQAAANQNSGSVGRRSVSPYNYDSTFGSSINTWPLRAFLDHSYYLEAGARARLGLPACTSKSLSWQRSAMRRLKHAGCDQLAEGDGRGLARGQRRRPLGWQSTAHRTPTHACSLAAGRRRQREVHGHEAAGLVGLESDGEGGVSRPPAALFPGGALCPGCQQIQALEAASGDVMAG